jgi:hypothetical protein
MAIGKGSALQACLDFEAGYGSAPAVPAGKIIPVISSSLECKQDLIDSEELNGNRNPTEPSVGNVSVSGDIVVAMRRTRWGCC